MKTIVLTDEQFDALLEIISHSDGNCLGNEAMARMYPQHADRYRAQQRIRDGLDLALASATVEPGSNHD